MKIKRQFVNELGNIITIEVEDTEIGNEPIHIKIVGPKSTSEDFITRLEAKHLRNSLNEILPY